MLVRATGGEYLTFKVDLLGIAKCRKTHCTKAAGGKARNFKVSVRCAKPHSRKGGYPSGLTLSEKGDGLPNKGGSVQRRGAAAQGTQASAKRLRCARSGSHGWLACFTLTVGCTARLRRTPHDAVSPARWVYGFPLAGCDCAFR